MDWASLTGLGTIHFETADLVAKAQDGDQRSYEKLFRRVEERLMVYIRARLGPGLRSKLDPDDVLQETYLKAHQSFHQFEAREEGAFLRWLYRMAENRIRDLAAHHSCQKRKPKGALVKETGLLNALQVSEQGPVTNVAAQEEQGRMLEALESLNDDERHAMILRFFHNMSYEEIGEEIDVSGATARRIVARATLTLGRTMKKQSKEA